MRKTIRWVLAHIGTFCGLLAALWLALTLSALIPNDALQKNYLQSALTYAQTAPFQFHSGTQWNAIGDNYADAIMLNVSWHMGASDPLTSVIDTRYYNGGEDGENIGLYCSVAEGAAPNTDYSRYWHGSAMFLRPLHLLTDVNGIKALGLAVVLVLLTLNMAMLIRKKHADIAILLALSLAAVQIWNIRLSLEYQPAFILTLLLCPLYLHLERKSDLWLSLLSVSGGTAIAFFDFLTTETLSVLLPLLLVISVRAKEGRLAPLRSSLFLLVRCGLCWAAAYAATFLVKWTAASVVSGQNTFALAFSSAAERMGTATTLEADAPSNFFSAIIANLTVVFGGTARVQAEPVIAGLLLYVGILSVIWCVFRKKPGERDAAILLLLLGGVVFLRYLALNNHSYMHEFFTYRALAAPILATLLALRLNISNPKKKRTYR